MAILKIGATVRVKPVIPERSEFHGRVGQLVTIDEHASAGDAFGVKLNGYSEDAIFFWRRELEECKPLTAVLNGEDEATAIATNDKGVTIEVTHYCNPLGGRPFWRWLECVEEIATDAVHIAFDFSDLGEELFARYGLDIDAAIWTRQQPEA